MEKNNIEKLADETINSFDGAQRAETKPFLLTRIYAKMQKQAAGDNIWSRAVSLLSTPRIALAGLLLIIILNVAVITQYSGNESSTSQNTATVKDEFAINVISIYDIENQEP